MNIYKVTSKYLIKKKSIQARRKGPSQPNRNRNRNHTYIHTYHTHIIFLKKKKDTFNQAVKHITNNRKKNPYHILYTKGFILYLYLSNK